MTSMQMNHDEFKETGTLSVCPSFLEQLENSGDKYVVEAAGNLEVFLGGQMFFCDETPTNTKHACYNMKLVVKSTR